MQQEAGTVTFIAVEEIGDGVSQVRVGDRVFGLARRGALAEEIAVPASELTLGGG